MLLPNTATARHDQGRKNASPVSS